jgi:hypothetical protein
MTAKVLPFLSAATLPPVPPDAEPWPTTREEVQAWWTRRATDAFLQARACAADGEVDAAMRWATYGHACERRAEAVGHE